MKKKIKDLTLIDICKTCEKHAWCGECPLNGSRVCTLAVNIVGKISDWESEVDIDE